MNRFWDNKIATWVLIGIVLFFFEEVATYFYRQPIVSHHIIGMPFSAYSASKIFNNMLQWHTDLSNYEFEYGEFADINSPCKTAFWYLESAHGEDRQEVLIIAYLVELAYYKPDNIEIRSAEISKTRMTVTRKDRNIGIERTAIFPYAVFNSRKYPNGEYLRLYGIDTTYCKDTSLGEWQAKIIEGNFEEIGFEVAPNDGFIKNIPETIDFGGRKHGSLIFLQDKNGRKLMMIQYVDHATGKEYKPYQDSLLSKLPSLSILK